MTEILIILLALAVILSVIGWGLYLMSLARIRMLRKEIVDLKKHMKLQEEKQRQNAEEIRKLTKEINAINSERERFNDRMKRIDAIFDQAAAPDDDEPKNDTE